MENMAVFDTDFTAEVPEVIESLYEDYDKDELLESYNDFVEDLIHSFTVGNKDTIPTTNGNLVKSDLFRKCRKVLHLPKAMDTDPETLFAIFDAFDQADSEDWLHDTFSNRVLYPVRNHVIKTFFFYLHDAERRSMLKNKAHRSLDMAATVMRRNMVHRTHHVIFAEEVRCACHEPVCSEIMLACDYCKTVLCENCADVPCAILIKGVIRPGSEMEEIYDDSGDEDEDSCGELSSSTDGDVEDSEEEEDDEEAMEIDEDTEIDEEDDDSDEEIVVD